MISSKDQIINLIGNPDFIDNHKMGEDWYYSHPRSVDYGLISFHPGTSNKSCAIYKIPRMEIKLLDLK